MILPKRRQAYVGGGCASDVHTILTVDPVAKFWVFGATFTIGIPETGKGKKSLLKSFLGSDFQD